jgi:hypothetical protein
VGFTTPKLGSYRWDATAGKSFSDVIEQELSKAKCMVVVWSRNSIKSNWVKNEARFGKERQTLIPVMIDNVILPIEFNHIEAAKFKRWTGDSSNLEQNNFINALRGIIKRKRPRLEFRESRTNYCHSVFLNCPLDEMYRPFFEVLAFTILSCGFQPRTTLEVPDAGETRLERIFRLISACKYGIHDISRTELSTKKKLPRFNIPLELGLFLGAQKFDPLSAKQKQSLVIDKEKFRYQEFISDLAGIDIASHEGNARALVSIVRDWLRVNSNQFKPSSRLIWEQFQSFTAVFS